jgi:hypothetical protein
MLRSEPYKDLKNRTLVPNRLQIVVLRYDAKISLLNT